jgi:hypothetical protein
MKSVTVYTLGDIARKCHCPLWAVRRVFTRGLLPEPPRVGSYRVVAELDLPAVVAALRTAGYLPADSPALA